MECKRCGKTLEGRQESWCSPRCSKLGLKALYRIRKKEKVNSYNRKYRKLNKGGSKYTYLLSKKVCYFCGTKTNLHSHHLNYEKNIVVRLCASCHQKHHRIIKIARVK